MNAEVTKTKLEHIARHALRRTDSLVKQATRTAHEGNKTRRRRGQGHAEHRVA